jgi:nucleoid-associated protein YgaU
MSRSFLPTLAALVSLSLLSHGQDAPAAAPADVSGDNVAALKAENAVLKKEVSDAKTTISKLQDQLAEAKITAAAAPAPAATASGAEPAAAPSGPMKALPLDSTNFVATPGAPGAPGAPATDAGPARSYTVVKGDSLWKIAHKMYPHDTKNGVDKLTEANKDTIGGKPLKIGMVLVVPQ